MAMHSKKILVAGGGITGLSAAYYLDKALREKGIHAEIILAEKSDRLGGKIDTLRRDGFIIEKGPDSFLARKLPMIDLVKDLGMEDQLVPTNPKGKKSYILYHRKLHPMPPGMVYGIPTKLAPFMKTGLVSVKGKLRAAMDLVLPRRKERTDESLGEFIRRRLGREVLEHIAEPLLAGIYAGDTRFLSLQATFPQFHQIENQYRSLMVGMAAGTGQSSGNAMNQLPPAAKNSIFLSLKNGLFSIIERLHEVLQERVRFLFNHSVERIVQREKQYCVTFSNGEQLIADGIILAAPAFEAATILSDLPAASKLKQIPYASVANVALAFDKKDASFKMEGSGFVIPRNEGTHVTACTWTSTKWLHVAPEDKVLLRLYVGHHGNDIAERLSEEEILAKVRADLKELMGITAEPLFYEITRWIGAMPQYPVGHLAVLNEVRAELKNKMPKVFIAGAAYQGIGLPDCVRQGREAAEQMIQCLQNE